MADAGQRHRLLAILAADAAAYSRLMARDEHLALGALESAGEVFRHETEAEHGRVVDTAGDSVLAVFETAAGAVDCATAVQRRLRANRATSDQATLSFRIAVHLGDVIEKADGTVYGNGVNVTIEHLRRNWNWRHPDYQRLAEAGFYPGLRKAGLPER